ncbi:MAG: RraA family protein [Prolixibacteraceae bacterium]|jgi:4-hydroxy-4-methyl-2-oxoglutarate aldolase|nr:RraA family protein [Prolixibacteraceae bacterium]MBT6765435.1 RraA family protein [Prolixibacteraceae bacterium]MBT6997854.1 RraA family protein [Prolixibacteraceae bacterium]MBT7394431.1 RraA family protein [Prolixibacteraceae bacterium]
MKSVFFHLAIFMMFFSTNILAQTDAEIASGISFIETQTYTPEENIELLKLYENLRVADVSDGMDMVGLPNTGLVDPAIHPDWVDHENLSHIIRGIAVTARYVPTQKPDRPKPDEDFLAWEGHFYGTYSHEAFTKAIQKGSVVVLDDVEDKDIGSIGSNNILGWFKAGAVGVVTDASSRDTDEIAIQKVPLYLRKKGRGIRPGRNELESVNRPVVIGGVLVCPGDVVVADGDGVVVVPRKVAKQVAEFAQEVLTKDKAGRLNLYKSLGLPLDKTVK